MVCFEVKRNGTRLCTAGINSKSILSAILTHVDVIDPGPKPRHTLDLVISGLNCETKQHMDWGRVGVRRGDQIEIRVIESDKADSPVHITKSQTRNAVAPDALGRIRARRKNLLAEMKNLDRDELAYFREAKQKERERRLAKNIRNEK